MTGTLAYILQPVSALDKHQTDSRIYSAQCCKLKSVKVVKSSAFYNAQLETSRKCFCSTVSREQTGRTGELFQIQ